MFNYINNNNNQNIINGKYKIIKKIGSGSFAKVFKAQNLNDGSFVAIKQVEKSLLERNDYLHDAFYKELNIMKLCNCENSVLLIEHFELEDNHNIVMELCDTDLEVLLNNRTNGFNENEVKIILTQLNKVFVLMNKANIIHRDLKLKNILIKYNESIPLIGFIAKLSDFGFSKIMDEDITNTKLGTPATMAPEILQCKPYNKKADLWSIGVITYQLVFKRMPFQASSERELLKTILNSNEINVKHNEYELSECFMELLKCLLQKNPQKRISFEEYFKHSFFKGCNGDNEIMTFEERFMLVNTVYDMANGDYKISVAKDKVTNEDVWIKSVLKKNVKYNEMYLNVFNKEMELIKKFNNGENGLVKYVDYYETESRYEIVFECLQGKILEDFINEHKSLSEVFVCNIIKQLIPIIKILKDNNVVLDYISPKSLCFKYYNSESDFEIKLIDYGLSGIFIPELERCKYLLNESSFGCVNDSKTNVLSFGLMVYRMLFNEDAYTFTDKATIATTINQSKLMLHICIYNVYRQSNKTK
jgi:serine/threonine protein kinase